MDEVFPPSGSNEPEEKDLFKHSDLNLDPSSYCIRLIKIHPADDDKTIKCDIKTATTSDEYICLSYVWGERSPGDWILVNGKKLYVRQNLRDFLNSAREMEDFRDKWIWIDALCIDQQNLKERGHQVQQMGRIFSNATRVVAWMGLDHNISRFLRLIKDRNYAWIGGRQHFTDGPYWRRAWITQEVALAREVEYMACNTILHENLLKSCVMNVRPSHWWCWFKILGANRNDEEKKSLVQLLDELREKECHEPRDRIFSMLALCWDGAGVEVNYSDSDEQCAWATARSCRHSLCLCSFLLITLALNLQVPQEISPSRDELAGQAECAELKVPVHRQIGADSIHDYISTLTGGFKDGSHSLDGGARQEEIKKCIHYARKSSDGVYLGKDQENQKAYARAVVCIDLERVCRKRSDQFLIIIIDLASGRSQVYLPEYCKPDARKDFMWSIRSFKWVFHFDLPLDARHCKLRMSITQLRQIAGKLRVRFKKWDGYHVSDFSNTRKNVDISDTRECCPRVNAVKGFSETDPGIGENDDYRLQLCTGVPGIYGC